MTLDVRGSLKNTKLSKNPFVVFDELFGNAVDAFLIRKNEDTTAKKLEITFTVTLRPADLMETDFHLKVQCEDNGCGFDDNQTKAFLTKDTSYKDDLPISGIGQCKGSGRVQYLHHFSSIDIQSVYTEDGRNISRSLKYDGTRPEIGPEDFHTSTTTKPNIGTTVTLSNAKPGVLRRVLAGKSIVDVITAKNLKTHILITFMQRLIGLRSQLGDFQVHFHVTTKNLQGVEAIDSAVLTGEDLPAITAEKPVQVHERDPETGIESAAFQTLTLSHYRLNAKQYDLPSNSIALCAKSSPVKIITERYLRTKTIANNPLDGFYHVILVEGDILDAKVNVLRDDFDIPDDLRQATLFTQDRISFEEIFDAIDDVIYDFVTPPDWQKGDIVREVRNTFGITEDMLQDTDTRIRYGDTPRSVAKRVLGKYQDLAIDDTDKLFDLKEEIHNLEPDSPKFREKVNELAWRYTATLKNIDMANLSQLVVRRSAIIEVLDLACRKQLRVQEELLEGKRKDEHLIHSVFFPKRKDSNQVLDHDIWLLSEEYQYFDYIASDMPLRSISWTAGDTLFEADIDDELAKLLRKNADDNGGKRPDIAIFSQEGSAVIIEFKSPGVDLADHIQDLMEYAQLLAAKSKGHLSKFYGYLIGDTINPNRVVGYDRFPSGRGWYGTHPIKEHNCGRMLGELNGEILYYEDVVKRAEKRLEVYKQRLSLKQ